VSETLSDGRVYGSWDSSFVDSSLGERIPLSGAVCESEVSFKHSSVRSPKFAGRFLLEW